MEYVNGFIDYLKLTKRVDIILKGKTDKKATAFYRGFYNAKGKLTRHTLTIHVGNVDSDVRKLKTLIAHELIHAAQEEKGLTEYHGPFFRKMAKRMERDFKGLKYMYIKEVDVK